GTVVLENLVSVNVCMGFFWAFLTIVKKIQATQKMIGLPLSFLFFCACLLDVGQHCAHIYEYMMAYKTAATGVEICVSFLFHILAGALSLPSKGSTDGDKDEGDLQRAEDNFSNVCSCELIGYPTDGDRIKLARNSAARKNSNKGFQSLFVSFIKIYVINVTILMHIQNNSALLN
ncbi:hypothetical protein ACJX0J_024644, partial [Zea mays]